MTEPSPKPETPVEALFARLKAAGITIHPDTPQPYDAHPEPTEAGGVTLSDAVIEERYERREWE
jgi:hypothetical protein